MRACQFVLRTALLILITAFSFFTSSAQLHAVFTATPQSGCVPLVVSFTDVSTGNPTGNKWDFGNGTFSNNNNTPSATYFSPGVYKVKLLISNGANKDSITSNITVYDKPQADFSVSATTGCFPLNVDFTDKSIAGSGTITKWSWDFGDGGGDVVNNPTHSYTSAGTFSLTLQVTNSFGCTNFITKPNLIKVNPGVTASFLTTAQNYCKAPAKFDFTNTSTGTGTLTYSWVFGDGGTATFTSGSHSYNNSGNYLVRLRVTSTAGCWDTATQKINVAFAQSDFSVPDNICSNKEVEFLNTSNPIPVSSNWNFGDGTTASTLNPLKTYTKPGSYNVKVVNIFSAGCTDSITKKVDVIAGPAVSFISKDTVSCHIPFTVHFQNTTVGAAVSYQWDFGDGNTDTSKNPVHTYNNFGIYTVSLKAINVNGCSDILVLPNFINISPLRIRSFTKLPDSACIPHTIHPGVLLNINENIVQYSWNFGDGTTSTSPNPSHTYTKEGFYKVSVTVTTENGCTDSYSKDSAVMVGHKPKASFTIDPTDACASESFHFTNTSTNGPIHFQDWSYAEHELTNIQPYTPITTWHNLNFDTGYFSVKLIVWNYGCTDTFVVDNAIHIKPPIAKIKQKNNCINKQVINFIDSSIGDKTWKWNFGDGKTDTAKNPIHNYANPGTYTVQLFTTNGGCADTVSATVNVVNEKAKSITDSVSCRNQRTTLIINNVSPSNIASTYWDYGNGKNTTVAGISTSTIYGTAGTFNVKAVYTDILGCTDSIIAPHVVYGPRADFLSLQTGACLNGTINFKDSSKTDGTHNINSWSWDFGDNKTATYSNPPFAHVYKDTGLYNIQMVVTDSYGCSDTMLKNKFIHITKPYAFFSISDTMVCPGKKITFSDSSVGVGLKYNWDFGDGSNSNSTSPVYLYSVKGTYTAKLFITDINNCKDSAVSHAIVVSTPLAKFNMSDSFSTCPPLNVSFTNHSTNYQTYLWDFGDGNTSSLANPSHTYTYPGTYPVRLILQGNGACQDSLVRNVVIKGPTGTFTYNSKPVCLPGSAQFTANAQNAAQYIWDFSDGNIITSIAPTAVHTYDTGIFVPKLILEDALGCKVPISGIDTIKVFKVIAGASVHDFILCDSGYINYKDSSYSNDKIIKYQWAFGDGGTSVQPSGTHYYSGIGSYVVKYIATSLNGCNDTLFVSPAISVVENLRVNILGDSAACSPANFSFKGNLVKPDTSSITWSWNYGNGTTGTGQNPPPANYTSPGNYTIRLVAINGNGCKDTSYKKIFVNPAPPVDAGPEATVCKNASYTLTPSGAVTYIWDPNPFLSCTNCNNPVATADTTTVFTVTGMDAIGCAARDSVLVKINPPITITASKDDTLCVGSSVKFHVAGANIYKWFPPTYLDDPNSDQPVFSAVTDTTITYRVTGTDDKNCYSDTATISVKVYPVPKMEILQKNITLDAGSSVVLSSINSPDITSWKWEPPQWLNSPNVPNPVANPAESITYVCAAVNGGGCLSRTEVNITVVCGSTNIYIPNTFSPNNDGVNDKFYVRGKGLFAIKSFRIFNRWGQLVFQNLQATPNDESGGWDGTFKNQKLSPDVYVYMVEILCANKTLIPVKGNVTLLR